MAQTWTKHVPDDLATLTAIPLEYHQLLQESMPVHKALVTTEVDGVLVELPTDFITAKNDPDPTKYGVSLTKQTFDPAGGELYVAEKGEESFKVMNSGNVAGEEVFVTVFWLP